MTNKKSIIWTLVVYITHKSEASLTTDYHIFWNTNNPITVYFDLFNTYTWINRDSISTDQKARIKKHTQFILPVRISTKPTFQFKTKSLRVIELHLYQGNAQSLHLHTCSCFFNPPPQVHTTCRKQKTELVKQINYKHTCCIHIQIHPPTPTLISTPPPPHTHTQGNIIMYLKHAHTYLHIPQYSQS